VPALFATFERTEVPTDDLEPTPASQGDAHIVVSSWLKLASAAAPVAPHHVDLNRQLRGGGREHTIQSFEASRLETEGAQFIKQLSYITSILDSDLLDVQVPQLINMATSKAKKENL